VYNIAHFLFRIDRPVGRPDIGCSGHGARIFTEELETLAEMIGTTRSRVSHFMNKFRKLGLISYNGHIEVNSSLLDAVLHDKPELKEDE